MLTIRQCAKLAGVTVRTLHHYDQIGLLTPARQTENGYRLYDEQDLLLLQQILFYRELGLELKEIKGILGKQGFSPLAALRQHRQALKDRAERLVKLMETVDRTIEHLEGGNDMDNHELFEGFSEEKQKEYAVEAAKLYGEKVVYDSQARWESYSPQRKKEILQNGSQVITQITEAIEHGAGSPQVQSLAEQWHRHIGNFYRCTYEVLDGLADLYINSPDFYNNFKKGHPAMPEFLSEAIHIYCRGKSGFLPE